ncbi:tellurium resistance protein TerC [Boudabousia liubingyangii]|uniref:Tellurium resistance protein TerC n=1 Tax=Boudabousia liubingyangii TaxID=1921764 RepID=A0A1Q5PNE6_9ACTO|nr:TerC family protein [Boudabousia liubingyangii]OKL47648.1 tellurium resistance protein TerC [Boudabousia liubingyangii]OKL49074.1 tellurium resistance protein TerC [Boudabousia liubingyangii]
MDVHILGWLGLAAIVIALLTVDFVGHVRSPHAPSMKEAATWSAAYIALAVSFGFLIWGIWDLNFATQYWAGWITEWSLSLDNLFVFVIILGAFRVPREYQQKVLLIGITLSLIFRFVFILVGVVIIEKFVWVFYIFGAFLIYTAIKQALEGVETGEHEDEEYKEAFLTRAARRVFPTTNGFVSDKMLHRHNGKTYITPMLLVIIAVGTADVMFAVDSIPAIFGLTKEPFLVFAANAFSLLGLRQLYFLIDGLLERLAYLHYGLAAILGFIGVKLVLHALHENSLPFINGGEGIHVWEPSINFSLAYIVVVLGVTIIASLLRGRREKQAEQPA